ncbi:uncharacterized protein RHIMIDRAFT_267392 [Rhizopus microsporus ATCC 52813]|uniref:Uncharacterized protein n=1 Tax=Rhizopus microsporus ATCC 52813 TaxID=1340429 RepID=A0A2G4SJP4_RHIZD|nr:uncharacterized protein RHIMIDRAFT_267392 [Rhizopus microsporus ATCC 52813]PHZ08997.1 hypothetical protein RHIMIDRAFT_267392 [Rhizopus microsporus ATCC 52813]
MKASFEERAINFATDALSTDFLGTVRRTLYFVWIAGLEWAPDFVRKGSDKLHSETFAKNLDIYNQGILCTE